MKKRALSVRKVLSLVLIICVLLISVAGVGEGEELSFEQIKDIVFETKVGEDRVFKYPKDNDNFYIKGMQFPCKGAMLLTITGVSDGKLEITSMLFVFDKAKDPDEHNDFTGLAYWEIESSQQENVLALIGDSLNKYIDFENGGKLTFCMTQHLDKETQILYEYSPMIDQFSDKDIYKTQNYAEYDSYEAFRDKVYDILYSANGGGVNASKEEEETEKEDKNLQKGSKGDEVVKLQNRLNELGYSVGKADGDFGNKTKSAIEQFQGDNGLDVTGIADEKHWNCCTQMMRVRSKKRMMMRLFRTKASM